MEYIIDLLIEFDEMGFIPTTTVPNPEAYAIKWREKITKEIIKIREELEKAKSDNFLFYNDLKTESSKIALEIIEKILKYVDSKRSYFILCSDLEALLNSIKKKYTEDEG